MFLQHLSALQFLCPEVLLSLGIPPPQLHTTLHFFKVLPHQSAKSGRLALQAPPVSKWSGCTPRPTALRKKCSKTHLPSKPRQLIRTCKGVGSPDRPLGLGHPATLGIKGGLEDRQRQNGGDSSELRAGRGHSVHRVRH